MSDNDICIHLQVISLEEDTKDSDEKVDARDASADDYDWKEGNIRIIRTTNFRGSSFSLMSHHIFRLYSPSMKTRTIFSN